jgi:hypothetical protein
MKKIILIVSLALTFVYCSTPQPSTTPGTTTTDTTTTGANTNTPTGSDTTRRQ